MSTDLKILVTGGSGFIGSNMISFLIDNDIECINIDYSPPKIVTQRAIWKDIDIRDKEELESEIISYQPTHIIHLAAATGMDVKDISFFNANTDGVQNIINAARKSNSIQKILFTSSLLVCENGYIPKDQDDYCPPNLYGKSKMIGEKIVKESIDLNFEWSIVRPTSVWGPWCDGGYTAFFQTLEKGYYMHPGKDNIIKPITFVGNAVYMMFRILLSDESNNDILYLSDYPETSTRNWASTIQRNLNSSRIKTSPIWLLKSFGIVGDVMKIFGYDDPPISSFRLNNMLTGGQYPVNNTQEICEYLPYDLDRAVQLTIEWLSDQNLLRKDYSFSK